MSFNVVLINFMDLEAVYVGMMVQKIVFSGDNADLAIPQFWALFGKGRRI